MAAMNTTLDQWEALYAVVQWGGFGPAAAHLNRSQSTISYAIRRLQEQIGIRIFELVGRRARLTESGRALLADVAPLLSGFVSLEGRARALASGGENQIGLAVDSIYPNERLFRALAEFTRLYPHVRLKVRQGVFMSSADAFATHGANLCITGFMPREYFSKPILDIRLLAVARANHPLLQKDRPLTRFDLMQHLMVVIEGTEGPTPRRQPRSPSQRYLAVNNIDAGIDAVRSGLCFGWLPVCRIGSYMRSGEIIPLPLPLGGERISRLYLVYADMDSAGRENSALASLLGADRDPEVM
jgi:DNA-binding transcriptional LysR family regulator